MFQKIHKWVFLFFFSTDVKLEEFISIYESIQEKDLFVKLQVLLAQPKSTLAKETEMMRQEAEASCLCLDNSMECFYFIRSSCLLGVTSVGGGINEACCRQTDLGVGMS